MMEYFVVVFIYKMQQLEIGCVGNIIFFQKYYRQLKKKGSYIHIYTHKRRFNFFLSIPIPGFVPSDRFAWNGPVRLSFTDRRNSSLRSSDTTGRPFGKPNRTLVPAPMVFRHKTLHLPSALQGKEGKFY